MSLGEYIWEARKDAYDSGKAEGIAEGMKKVTHLITAVSAMIFEGHSADDIWNQFDVDVTTDPRFVYTWRAVHGDKSETLGGSVKPMSLGDNA